MYAKQMIGPEKVYLNFCYTNHPTIIFCVNFEIKLKHNFNFETFHANVFVYISHETYFQ